MNTTELVPATDGSVATAFDYASVDEGTRRWLLEQAAEIRERERQTLVAAADIGRRLREAHDRLDLTTVVAWAGTEFGYKKTMVVNLMRLSSRYGALIKVTNVIPPAISPHAMFRLGRDSLDAEVRRELLDRAM